MNWQGPGPTPEDLNPDWDDEGIDDRDDFDDGLDSDPSPLPPWQIHGGDPWARQHREPANSFQAFTVYRDLGPSRRSISEVYRRGLDANGGQVMRGWTRNNIGRWSSRWWWVERARLWDERQHRIQVEEFDTNTRTMARRHSDLARLLLRGAFSRMVGVPADEATNRPEIKPLDLNELTPLDVARFARYGVQIEAAAMTGLAPSRAEELAEAAAAAAARAPGAVDDAELEQMRAEVMAMLQNRTVPGDEEA